MSEKKSESNTSKKESPRAFIASRNAPLKESVSAPTNSKTKVVSSKTTAND